MRSADQRSPAHRERRSRLPSLRARMAARSMLAADGPCQFPGEPWWRIGRMAAVIGRPLPQCDRPGRVPPCSRRSASPSFFFSAPEKTPRTVCGCHPVAAITSATVAPSGRRSRAMTSACFEGRLATGLGSGKASNAAHNRSETPRDRRSWSTVRRGKAIPQRQQPLAAEARRLQFLDRGNSDRVVINRPGASPETSPGRQ